MINFGKIFVVVGGVFIVLGLVLILAPRIPVLGKLPGDIHIKKENFEIFIPLATSLLLSIILSGIFWLISFLGKK